MKGMEFKRVETKRVVAAQKTIGNVAEIKSLFEAIRSSNLKFAITIGNQGSEKKECSVLSITDDSVVLHSAKPCKVKMTAKFTEILVVEVEYNGDFMAEESDEEGRWARIL